MQVAITVSALHQLWLVHTAHKLYCVTKACSQAGPISTVWLIAAGGMLGAVPNASRAAVHRCIEEGCIDIETPFNTKLHL